MLAEHLGRAKRTFHDTIASFHQGVGDRLVRQTLLAPVSLEMEAGQSGARSVATARARPRDVVLMGADRGLFFLKPRSRDETALADSILKIDWRDVAAAVRGEFDKGRLPLHRRCRPWPASGGTSSTASPEEMQESAKGWWPSTTRRPT
jgi:hypothetical protein